VSHDDWFFASSWRNANSIPIRKSGSGSWVSSVAPNAIRIALLASPSDSVAPRVFMVSTVASKPSFRWTYKAWVSAKFVAWPGTTSCATRSTNSGTEI
jgi:hypothetical protein